MSGMTYMENLQDNLQTFSPLDVCTPEEFVILEEVASEVPEYTALLQLAYCALRNIIQTNFLHYHLPSQGL